MIWEVFEKVEGSDLKKNTLQCGQDFFLYSYIKLKILLSFLRLFINNCIFIFANLMSLLILEPN